MAKRRRRRKRGFGSTLVVRRGLGRKLFGGSGVMSVILPPAIGVGVAALTVIGIRHFAKPEGGDATQAMLWKNAGLFGLGAGAVASVALYMLGGTRVAVQALVGAAGVGAAVLASDYFVTSRPAALASLAGLGAIVPEYAGMQGAGLGAIVMTPALNGARGEEVQLGAINPGAFGTPGFHP